MAKMCQDAHAVVKRRLRCPEEASDCCFEEVCSGDGVVERRVDWSQERRQVMCRASCGSSRRSMRRTEHGSEQRANERNRRQSCHRWSLSV